MHHITTSDQQQTICMTVVPYDYNIIIYYNTILLQLPTVFSTVICCQGL